MGPAVAWTEAGGGTAGSAAAAAGVAGGGGLGYLGGIDAVVDPKDGGAGAPGDVSADPVALVADEAGGALALSVAVPHAEAEWPALANEEEVGGACVDAAVQFPGLWVGRGLGLEAAKEVSAHVAFFFGSRFSRSGQWSGVGVGWVEGGSGAGWGGARL